ncbi:OmpP1/FadL family transporter [Odoribacter lunatus]|uniref:OmpP1/FadL family transporter n=1 Tax=Odoribacter lunatus TaxID=2941335 RepID=UPI002041CFDA|nr:hypothetical protein [Odoribacter lunatus]
MKTLYFLTILLFLVIGGFAQTTTDVVRFSQSTNFGTARSTAMSGAFGALGGDLSVLSSNPAGIGVFRKSEISLTLSSLLSNTKSDGRSATDNSFQLGDLGAAIVFYSPDFDWRGFNFGINYTNMNNFNRHTDQYVAHSLSSFSQAIAHRANYDIEYDFAPSIMEDIASQSNVILMDDATGFYSPAFIGANQWKTIKEDGYQGEYTFSVGTNYKDKLYLGLSIGLQSIYYKSKSMYTETPDKDNPYELNYFDYMEQLKTTGVGTNVKFGVIYRPIPELRLGAAIHTPTYYSMTDRFYCDMFSSYKTPDAEGYYNYLSEPYEYKFDYELRTPWRALLSIATVIQQKAILSVDYEYIDYTSAKLSNGDGNYDFYDSEAGTGTNNDIKRYLRSTHNVRIGAEYRYNSLFSLRGGYSCYASPYKYDKDLHKLQTVSAGFGLNFGQFYCDVAYLYKFSKDTTLFYSYLDPDDAQYDVVSEAVSNKYNNHEARITLGIRF